jgi:uncharacterized repeat protein (TIGR01451 family)
VKTHRSEPTPSSSPTAGPASVFRRWATIPLSLLLAVLGLAVLAGPAVATPVYEITGAWEAGTPGTVASGDVVTAVWRVNVNDDQPAPANDPVDNVTFTVTVQNSTFRSLPNACKTTGVTPASSISADGMTLVCNLGTHNEGTAVVVQSPLLVDGPTGSQVTGSGTIAGQTANLPPLDIVNPFDMDIRWNTGTAGFSQGGGAFEMDMQWTLSRGRRSDPGPQTITYNLNIASPQGAPINVAPQACTPFTSGAANGHPWSGGTHPANQMTSFVGSCTFVQTGPTTFQLVLTGINYNPATPPTLDSTGSKLPVDEVAVASGSIWIRVVTSQQGSAVLTSNAPIYTSTTGATVQDDPSNNTESKAWTTPGLYSSGWGRGFTGSGGTTWDNTYQVSAGTAVGQYMHTLAQLHDDLPGTWPVGMCSKLDTKYVTYNGWSWGSSPIGGVAGAVVDYYTGAAPTMDPASPSYDPNAFGCAGAAGWSTTAPANPALVKAVRITMTEAQARQYKGQNIMPVVGQIIKPATPSGTDVWSFMEAQVAGDGSWYKRDEICITPIPGGRYPCTTGFADVLHVVAVTPAIQKSVDRSVVTPGVPATYTLTYSANGAGAVPPTVDGFQIVDTLPLHMTYVPGSATPAPTVTTNGSGQQVLTWTINGVTTNVDHPLTYQAVADSSATPGQSLTNSAVALVGGLTSGPATAQVAVATDGYTVISKTADAPFIPNLDGSGDGAGSWTVTVRSFDPLPQAFTDTIDILPWEGDGRGTDYDGSYALTQVDVPNGQTVYYTTAPPATLSDDPAAAANGAPNAPSPLWSTTKPANPTAIRVIGPALAPGATQQFRVHIQTDGAHGEDLYVNRAQARAEHTELVMRTSAPISVANFYSASLKKYVQDRNGVWHDANDVADYPTFQYGDTVRYRIVVTNTGQGTLTNIDVTDDQQPALGAFHIASLAPGASQSHEYSIVLDASTNGSVVNTASATADTPPDSNVPPTIPADPAGFDVANYITKKEADPASGTAMQPGQVIHYTISVTQQGTVPAQAVFTDNLADVLDDANYNGDVSATIGTVQYVNQSLVWSGTIPVGQVAYVTYSVTIKAGKKLGNRDLVNPVTSPGCAVKGGKVVDCDTDHNVPKFDLAVQKEVVGASTVMVGDQVRYRIQVTNKGPDVAPAPIELKDPLPNGLELVSAKGKGWDCKVKKATDVVKCTRDTLLEPGKKAPPVFVVAKTTKAATGELINVAQVSANGDRVRSNNRDVAGVQVSSAPALPGTGFRLRLSDLF